MDPARRDDGDDQRKHADEQRQREADRQYAIERCQRDCGLDGRARSPADRLDRDEHADPRAAKGETPVPGPADLAMKRLSDERERCPPLSPVQRESDVLVLEDHLPGRVDDADAACGHLDREGVVQLAHVDEHQHDTWRSAGACGNRLRDVEADQTRAGDLARFHPAAVTRPHRRLEGRIRGHARPDQRRLTRREDPASGIGERSVGDGVRRCETHAVRG